MGLVDDLSIATSEVDLDRRKALGQLTGAAFGVAVIGTVITSVRYLRPNVLFEPATKFRVGRPEEIPVGTLVVMPEQKLYVMHGTDGFFAMSATCTHLGCMTRYFPDEGRIDCPCHGSKFDQEGNVTAGPAPRPLDRRHIELVDGELVVDTRKPADADYTLRA